MVCIARVPAQVADMDHVTDTVKIGAAYERPPGYHVAGVASRLPEHCFGRQAGQRDLGSKPPRWPARGALAIGQNGTIAA
jgi:hypothetical protein